MGCTARSNQPVDGFDGGSDAPPTDVSRTESASEGVAPRARRAYDACEAGDRCGDGTQCAASAIALAGGAPGSLCTVTCTPGGSTCRHDGGEGVCVVTSSSAQCFRACANDGDCGTGAICASAGGVLVCVPSPGGAVVCGAEGRSCCAGDLCNAGLACTARVCTSPATAYGACAPAGGACSDGTQCLQALARAPSTPVGNTCTAACTSGASCPGYAPGAQVDCVSLPGAAMAQCVRLCASAADCAPYRTQCLAVQNARGATVQICAP